jgi:hypothetical protein
MEITRHYKGILKKKKKNICRTKTDMEYFMKGSGAFPLLTFQKF